MARKSCLRDTLPMTLVRVGVLVFLGVLVGCGTGSVSPDPNGDPVGDGDSDTDVSIPSASHSTFTAAASTATANLTDAVVLTLLLRDSADTPIADAAVTFSATGGSNNLTANALRTDADGRAQATLTSSLAESKTVTATVTGAFGLTANVEFLPGPLATVSFEVPPSNAVAGVALTPAVVIVLHDAHDNVVDDDESVTLTVGGDEVAQISSDAGRATFGALSFGTAGSYELVAHAAGIDSSPSSTFVISAAAAAKLVFSVPPPSSLIAGVAFGTTVVLQDAFDNPVTDNGTLISLASQPIELDASLLTTAGVAAFTGLTFIAGGDYILTASAPDLAGDTTATLTVSGVAIDTQPADQSVVAPAAATFTVVATGHPLSDPLSYQWRRNGVNIDGATSASYMTSATTAAADDGATFSCVVSNSVTEATSNAATLTVNAGPPSPARSTFTTSDDDFTSDDTVTLTLTLHDANDNVVKGLNVMLSDGAGFNASGTTSNAGVFAAPFNSTTLGLHTITARFGGEELQLDVTVRHGAPAVATFTIQPNGITAGTAFAQDLKVALSDSAGHPTTTFTGGVSLVLPGAPTSVVNPGPVTPVSGVATFPAASVTRAGANFVLEAHIGGVSRGSSNQFSVAPAAPNQAHSFAEFSDGIADGGIHGFVLIRDQYDNPIPGLMVGFNGEGTADTNSRGQAERFFRAEGIGDVIVTAVFNDVVPPQPPLSFFQTVHISPPPCFDVGTGVTLEWAFDVTAVDIDRDGAKDLVAPAWDPEHPGLLTEMMQFPGQPGYLGTRAGAIPLLAYGSNAGVAPFVDANGNDSVGWFVSSPETGDFAWGRLENDGFSSSLQSGAGFVLTRNPQDIVFGNFFGPGTDDDWVLIGRRYFAADTDVLYTANGELVLPPIFPSQGVAGDFDDDGSEDVAISQFLTTSGFWVDWGLTTVEAFSAPTPVRVFGAGDFNADGITDLAIGSDTGVFAALANGDRTFDFVAVGATADAVQNLGIADLNGDGIDDIVGRIAFTALLYAWTSNGDGTFTAAPPVPCGLDRAGNDELLRQGLAILDLNGDTHPDVATAGTGATYVNFGVGDGTFHMPRTQSVPASHLGVVADFDNDDKLDLMTQSAVRRGNGDGTWQAPQSISLDPALVTKVATGDFNEDGRLDYVTSDSQLRAFVQQNDGSFAEVLTSAPASAFDAFDYNADGHLDVVMQASNQSLLFFAGSGAGAFAAPTTRPLSYLATELAHGDIDDDGAVDLVIASTFLDVMYGNGSGALGAPAALEVPVGVQISNLRIADFNNDGRDDIVFSRQITSDFRSSIFTRLSLPNDQRVYTSPFQSGSTFTVELGNVADVNGDGYLDIALAQPYFGVLLNNHDGSFSLVQLPGLVSFKNWAAIGDLDNDGTPEVIGQSDTFGDVTQAFYQCEGN